MTGKRPKSEKKRKKRRSADIAAFANGGLISFHILLHQLHDIDGRDSENFSLLPYRQRNLDYFFFSLEEISMATAVVARSKGWMIFSPLTNQVRELSELVKQNGNGRKAFLVDTLGMVRRLEGQGVPSKHAEAITSAITEVLSDSLENVSHSFVSNERMNMSEMIQDSNLSKFKSEVKSSQCADLLCRFREFLFDLCSDASSGVLPLRQIYCGVSFCCASVGRWPVQGSSAFLPAALPAEHHFSSLQRETEKLRVDIEKMRSELRYEIDKVTAGQRLDLNLERGRLRDELAKHSAETSDLTNKLDREIHALKAHLEAAKYDVIKYCIGTLVSISAVGLAVIRILM
ncbi:hypothetical protein KSP40_PGU005813 [Platanthera guangdongensis]|uniref:Uncharacterized protein n=1 Tax=Platanthera guangdongensis TaxID=2320717 RepID=A0ABR2MNV8_9ASPA